MRLDARKRACLDAMGIELWRTRARQPEAGTGEAVGGDDGLRGEHAHTPAALTPEASAGRVPETASGRAGATDTGACTVTGPGLDRIPTLDWKALHETVSNCQACGLHQTRTQTVFGVGDENADLMIIGEAPGADEDRQGEPFVGRAGQLLNAMLEAIGLQRGTVYIANIIKCRPPGNRDPHSEEAAACQPFLHRQIELIRPRLILSVGRVSAHNLLGTEESVGRLRGRVHRFDPGDIPLIVTYHPAYLLRRPLEKAKAWQDLQAVHRLLTTGDPGS